MTLLAITSGDAGNEIEEQILRQLAWQVLSQNDIT
jgi:hypothetical protein